ncbi:ATP-binding protein [Streptomyces sp. NPDC059679]|uniref:tetratricopeptide repeat protein n=1 Tax=Streptomyces sp. NPDC059679 TaxID=3346903 RepID=UPI00369F0E3F
MNEARVVVVRSGGTQGSGYVLARRLVITAAHVIQAAGQPSVQMPGRPGRVNCRAVWSRYEDGPRGVWDAALLLAEEDLLTDPVLPVRWGRLVTVRPVPAQALGYPVVARTPDQAVSVEQRAGEVQPVSGADRDRYVLSGPAGADARGGDSPWGGMSGAALWSGSDPRMPPLLTGVVVGDPPGWTHTHLEAVPAYVLAGDPEFRALVEEHTGRPVLLEPADLQHVTDAVPRAPRSPADLLRPEQAVVSFQGRGELLRDLIAWCRPDAGPGADEPDSTRADSTGADATGAGLPLWGDGMVQARLLTGPGGAGKTRLATELAAWLARHGWTTIRLTADPDVTLHGLSGVRRRLLVIVDYAETRTAQLTALLQVLDHEQASTPVRVLALARTAGDWWTRASEHRGAHVLATARVQGVPPLHHTVRDRSEAYRQALRDLAPGLRDLAARRTAPRIDWDALAERLIDEAALPPLGSAQYDQPLSVQMAALTALLDATGTTDPPEQPHSLEGKLLGHERRYWDETAAERGLTGERITSETRRLAVALACLVPAADRSQARDLLARIPGLGGEDAGGLRGVLTTWLTDLYSATGGSSWGNLQPDRIAEHHLAGEVEREPELFTRTLTALREAQATHALTVLTRAAERPHHGDTIASVLRDALTGAPDTLGVAAVTAALRTAHPRPLIDALIHLTTTAEDIGLIRRLIDQARGVSLPLNDWLATATTTLVQRLDRPGGDRAALADALNSQSRCLATLGQPQAALKAATRAITIYKSLPKSRSDPHLISLAVALEGRATLLTDLGRHSTAREEIDHAIRTFLKATEIHPTASLVGLAGAWNNKARILSGLGRLHEALEAADHSVEIRTELADALPDEFRSELAISLLHQANCRWSLGRRTAALQAVTRAVDIYRELADNRPHSHLSALAGALNNQAGILSELGRYEAALEAATESVALFGELVESHPEAARPSLANSLNTQAGCLRELGRQEDSLQAVSRALTIFQELAETLPDSHRADLAAGFNNQSTCLVELGRHEEALAAVNQAVDIREELARAKPDAFLPDLANSLHNQASCLAELGRTKEATEAAARAVRLRKQLAEAHPSRFTPDYERSRLLYESLKG